LFTIRRSLIMSISISPGEVAADYARLLAPGSPSLTWTGPWVPALLMAGADHPGRLDRDRLDVGVPFVVVA
jgi:hypothetical protein